MDKGGLPIDPRGLIYEAYRLPDLSPAECRTIFLDWALGVVDGNPQDHVTQLMQVYGANQPNHPMTAVLAEGLAPSPDRRQRRRRRSSSEV